MPVVLPNRPGNVLLCAQGVGGDHRTGHGHQLDQLWNHGDPIGLDLHRGLGQHQLMAA